jgi:glycolate oxidase iron-sulfur subunit
MSALRKLINYENTMDCVQCGYCLPVCPTYESMKTETHSPRGRINLVKQFANGNIDLETLKDPIEKCLGCMACVTACPTNVKYGSILSEAKNVLAKGSERSILRRITEKVTFDLLIPSRFLMRILGDLLWLFRKSGLIMALRSAGFFKVIPFHLGDFESVLPPVGSPRARRNRVEVLYPASSSKARAGFFMGCVMESMLSGINTSTIDLLLDTGVTVVAPRDQTCCGALHAHAGRQDKAKKLAMRNIEAFENGSVDFIVTNAGGCGAHLIKYEEYFGDDLEWAPRAKAFSSKIKDISEVLDECDDLIFSKKLADRATYQSSCHLLNVQHVDKSPLRMINSIPGVNYCELEGYERCCGSAGIYNIENFEESMVILDAKIQQVIRTGADTIVTTNPGCLLQMKLGIERHGLRGQVRAVHLVELLREANLCSGS